MRRLGGWGCVLVMVASLGLPACASMRGESTSSEATPAPSLYRRLGGREGIAVDVRVVCATNKDLPTLVETGAFRQDLFYRISEVTVRIPPLRDRPGDAIVIAQTVMERRAREHSRSLRGFTPDALKAIQGYPWPGNIRELENRVTSAVIMSEGKHIGVDELGLVDVANAGVDWLNLRAARHRAESDAIRQALALSHGNLSRAAELLGITRPTLYDLLEKNSISVTERATEKAKEELE